MDLKASDDKYIRWVDWENLIYFRRDNIKNSDNSNFLMSVNNKVLANIGNSCIDSEDVY